MVDEMDSLSPILTAQVKDSPQREVDFPDFFWAAYLLIDLAIDTCISNLTRCVSDGSSFVEMMLSVFHLNECD